MNPEDTTVSLRNELHNAFEQELKRLAGLMVDTGASVQQWGQMIDRGLIPDVPEAKNWSWSTQMWPMYLRLPLNKALISDVVKRFTELGWKAEPWSITEWGVSIDLELPDTIIPSAWKWKITIRAGGEGQGCQILKISEQKVETTCGVFELVCNDGVAEMKGE